MWNKEKQDQFEELRGRADRGPLPAQEQDRLQELIYELEQAEWAALRPSLEALRQEQQQLQVELGQLQSQNAMLGALAERYADLLARARAQLVALTSEREALRAEYRRVQP